MTNDHIGECRSTPLCGRPPERPQKSRKVHICTTHSRADQRRPAALIRACFACVVRFYALRAAVRTMNDCITCQTAAGLPPLSAGTARALSARLCLSCNQRLQATARRAAAPSALQDRRNSRQQKTRCARCRELS